MMSSFLLPVAGVYEATTNTCYTNSVLDITMPLYIIIRLLESRDDDALVGRGKLFLHCLTCQCIVCDKKILCLRRSAKYEIMFDIDF